MSGIFSPPIFLGIFTFADRPSASAVPIGSIARFSDIGPGLGSFWISDGTYWRPLNGRALLYEGAGTLANPIGTLSLAAGTSQVFTLSTPCLIPAGLVFPNSYFEILANFIHRGTAGVVSARIGVNTNSTGINQTVQGLSLLSSDGSGGRMSSNLLVRSLISQMSPTFAQFNAAIGPGAFTDFAINFGLDQYIVFGVITGTSGTAPDTLDLLNYSVSYIG